MRSSGYFIDPNSLIVSVNGQDYSNQFFRNRKFSIGRLNLEDGEYLIKAKIANYYGRFSKAAKRKVIIDTIAPEIIFADESENIIVSQRDYFLDVQVTDRPAGLNNRSIIVVLNGKDITKKLRRSRSIAKIDKFERRITGTIELLENQENTLIIAARDNAGNFSKIQKTISVDSVDFTLSNLSPEEGQIIVTNTGSIEIKGESNRTLRTVNINGVQATIDESGLTFSSLLLVNTSGSQTIEVTAEDQTGRTTSVQYDIDINFDNIAPIVSLQGQSNFVTDKVDYSFSVSIEDVNSISTEVRLNGNPIKISEDKSITVEASLSEGLNKFDIVSTDIAGDQPAVFVPIN